MTKMIFINKNAGSKKLSRSDGVERSQIFSHVQRGPRLVLPKTALNAEGQPDTPMAEVSASKNGPLGRRSISSSGGGSCPSQKAAKHPARTCVRDQHPTRALHPSTFSDATNDLLKGTAGFMNPYMQVMLDFCKPQLPVRRHFDV